MHEADPHGPQRVVGRAVRIDLRDDDAVLVPLATADRLVWQPTGESLPASTAIDVLPR